MEQHDIESSSVTSPNSPQRASQDPGQKSPEMKSEYKAKQEWLRQFRKLYLPCAADRWKERENDFTPEEKKKAWDETAKIVKNYSDELVKRWKEEIDTLLVYGGLFSAVLTALIVESYKLLSPPPPDPVLTALHQISIQLSSFSVNPSFVNSTQPIVSQALPPAPPAPRWAVWLNALWFSSLIFSLSAASVGIMVKQWLNEYSTGLFGDSRHFARLRQHRLRNLEKWHVADIVAVLPVLLQIALVLFFGGLLILLWGLNSDVAAVASALVGLLFVFTIGSSIIPIFRADCCFLSPPVYVLFNAMRPVKAAIFHLHRSMWNVLCRIRKFVKCADDGRTALSDWLKKDRSWTFTWRGRELRQIHRSSEDLDAAMVTKACATTDQSYLNDYATICISDFQDPSQVADCYRGLVSEMNRHQQDTADIPLPIQSDVWLAVTYTTKYMNKVRVDGLPDLEEFWVSENRPYCWPLPTGASSHWHSHLWANVLIQENSSVAYEVIDRLRLDYDHCSDTVRQRALVVFEQELKKHVQKADDESLERCSNALSTLLLGFVSKSCSAKETQDAATAKAIRALTRSGLLRYFKCYTTEAGKTLSLANSEFLFEDLHTISENQAPNLMTRKLVDVLVQVYELHQAEFQTDIELKDWEPWILKLKRERDASKKKRT